MRKRCAVGKFLNDILFIILLVIPFVTSIDSHADDSNPAMGIRSETVTPDLFTGTASYSIPIKVPFGRNDMNPDLALTYRSTNGNGWLGVGWELEVGSIEMATKEIANLGTGFIFRRSGSAVDLYNNGDGTFSPIIEGEFNKIQKLTSPIDGFPYWTVTSKNGVTYRYGYRSASRQDDPGQLGVPNPANIFKWCLDQIQDTNGNTISYSYIKDSGQIYLDEIDYTSNGTTGSGATNYVKFYRESGRFDASIEYKAGFAVTTKLRLKSIDVVANTSSASKTRVRAYALGYNTATNIQISPTNSITGRSLLATVTEYGSDATVDTTTGPARMTGTQLPAISFDYQSTDPALLTPNEGGWTIKNWTGPTINIPNGNQCIQGDFNGDGLTDLLCNQGNGSWNVYWSSVTGWSEVNYSTPNFVVANPLNKYCTTGDFYGMGTSQLACNFTGYNWSILSFNKDSSGTLTPQSSSNIIGGGTFNCIVGNFLVGGQADIACNYGTGTWSDVHYYANLALPRERPSSLFIIKNLSSVPSVNPIGIQNNCLSGNFTGAGNDVIDCNGGNGNWYVGANTWSGPNINSNYSVPSQCLPGDFNGDGITDMICNFTSNGATSWNKVLSSENGWVVYALSGGPTILPLSQLGIDAQCIAGDFNGDGITDLACYSGSGGIWNVSLSTGSGWLPTMSWSGPTPPYPLTQYPLSSQCITGDFNGDGKTDIACLSSTGGTSSWNVALSHTFPTDLLSSIANGIGGLTTIQYTPSTQYQNTQLPFPIQVVSKVTQCDNYQGSNCVGNLSETDYTYAGGFYYNSSHEFRGFNYVMQTNPAGPNKEQTITETWFHQGDDLTVGDNNQYASIGKTKGKPYEVRVSDGQRNLISDTTITYVDTNPPVYNGSVKISGGTAPYFTPPQEVDTYITDCNPNNPCNVSTNARQTKTVYSYDSYGNVTEEDRYGDISNPADPMLNMTISRSYQPNLTNWIVGLPANESVFQGIGTTNTGDNLQVSHTDYYYDDLADCAGAPSPQPTAKGNLTRIVRWLKDSTTSPEYRMAYDNYGNLKCTGDPNGYVTRTGYDATYQTFPTSSTNALAQTTTSGYYGVGTTAGQGTYGQLASITDPNTPAATVSFWYDVNGRKTRDIQPDGFWTSYAYNAFGTVGSQYVTVNNQLGLWSNKYFDGLGRTTTVHSSGPDNKLIVTYMAYDQRGLVSMVAVPHLTGVGDPPVYQSYTYDAIGRVTKTTNPDGTFTLSCYNDLVSVHIDENHHLKRYTQDPLGRLVKVEEFTGVTTTCDTSPLSLYATTNYTYDVLGNLTGVTDAHNNVTTIHYDTLGRKIDMTDPDMGLWSYTYDNAGNLITQTDANQQKKNSQPGAKRQTITFTYDALNRLTNKQYPNDPEVVLTYDDTTISTYAIGRLSKTKDASGQTVTVYNYDSSGRTTSITRTIGGLTYNPLTFSYVNSRLDRITYPDNDYVDYRYQPGDGSLYSVLASDGSSYVTYGSYDALGRPGGASYGNSGIATLYKYDSTTKRLRELTVNSTNLGTLLDNVYGYDNKGNVTSITDNLNKTLLTNNFASESYTPAADHVHAIGSTGSGRVFNYDPNGNITNDGQRSLIYNDDNMPATVNGVSLTYDGNGKRVQKVGSNGATTVYFDNLFECTNGYCDKHIYGGDGRIAIKTAAQTFYLHGDHLGSTAVVTDSSGNQRGAIAYYPFGENRSDDSSAHLHYKFTGQELDSETNLYNYNARLYDPDLARFLSPDSVVPDPENPQSLNRYSYVLNNPTNLVDPTGHEACGPNTVCFNKNPDENSGDTESGTISLPIGTALKNFGNSIGKAVNDIGSFFHGFFGGGERSSYMPKQNTYNIVSNYTRTFTSVYNLGYTNSFDGTNGGSSVGGWSSGIKLPLINNFIEPSNQPGSDAEMALNFVPIGSVEKASSLVYRGLDDAGIIRYIGRTARNAAERFDEHSNSPGTGKELLNYFINEDAAGLTKIESRIAEQLQINLYGLQKNGGQLLNKINSIAPKYWQKYGILP